MASCSLNPGLMLLMSSHLDISQGLPSGGPSLPYLEAKAVLLGGGWHLSGLVPPQPQQWRGRGVGGSGEGPR